MSTGIVLVQVFFIQPCWQDFIVVASLIFLGDRDLQHISEVLPEICVRSLLLSEAKQHPTVCLEPSSPLEGHLALFLSLGSSFYFYGVSMKSGLDGVRPLLAQILLRNPVCLLLYFKKTLLIDSPS